MTDRSPLNSEIYELFGKIINLYADLENGLKLILAGMLKLSLEETFAISSPYSTQKLRDVVRTILQLKLEAQPQLKELEQVLEWYLEIAPLRNHIAHDRWMAGAEENTIRPLAIGMKKSAVVVKEGAGEFSYDRLQGALVLLNVANNLAIKIFRECGYDKHLGL